MDCLEFTVNGVPQKVGSNVSSDMMLLQYIRNHLELRGTKYLCREGGCGACIVTASKTPGAPYMAINSCLTSVASCHGWDIRTIEGLGNRKDGYHILQTTIAESHASQCGHCAPGWLMTMHGLMETNKNLTMLEIEKSLSSNLCRCTGYRPILDAMKKFAIDAPVENRIKNVKDKSVCKTSGYCCQSSNNVKEDGWCVVRQDDFHEESMKEVTFKDGKKWYRPTSLAEVQKLVEENCELYMLMAGNTSKGAFPIQEYPNTIIDVNNIQELKTDEMDQNVILGAGLNMTEFMGKLKIYAAREGFSYLYKIVDHMEMVAHIPIRNVASVAGNLMIKHAHNVFQSDVYLTFSTVGVALKIVDCYGVEEIVTMSEFLNISMKRKIIVSVMFRPLNETYKLFTYKLMPRAQSAHAIVNFGFLCKLNSNNEVEECTIRYGALSEHFNEAVSTERYLLGKSLFTNETLQGALRVLDAEMIVDVHLPEPGVEYRRFIAKALFFKALLNLSPERPARCDSAIVDLHLSRPCSSGKQTYTTDTSLWPLNEPVAKLEAKVQCSGELRYTEDIPSMPNEVFAALVLSTVAKGTILKMDPSEALAIPGVIAFYTAKDIPGLNSFTPTDSGVTPNNEEVLCSGTIVHHSQPIGIIVAETQNLADKASKLIKVTYTNITTPVTDINVAKEDSTRNTLFIAVDATNPGTDVSKRFTGSNILYGQYHFPMETMVCVATPTEEGLEVHSATQWIDGPQVMISRALNIDQNKVDVYTGSVGGSFGQKITRSILGAICCSLVAYKENRPCRLIQPLVTNMKAFGKRMGNVIDYEVAVDKSGIIQYLNNTIYTDNGCMVNEPIIAYGYDVYNNVYDVAKINYKAYNTCTDTPKNTFCRSPGTLEAVASIETIMERISYELSLDPMTVRRNNLNTSKYSEMAEIMEALEKSSELISRQAAVACFNTENRWKKRGLRCCVCRWPPVGGFKADVNIAIYQADGSIIITHGGIEMGQGVNTKVAQVVAHLLGVPLNKIQIKNNNTIISPNCFVTGGSITTDAIIIALKRCVEQILARLAPIKASLTEPTWSELIKAAFAANVDLQAHGYVSSADAQSYEIYGMACCEVEVDVLTGESEILRVDILQDVGFSICPTIDIGQIEGAFVMGLGYWTCEKLIYDPDTGELLTERSWDYHLPEARDIPQHFEVTCRNDYSNELILGSKGVGEPATCLSVVAPFAYRAAIVEGRKESGIPSTEWFNIDGPYSTEKICMAMKTKTEDFKLK